VVSRVKLEEAEDYILRWVSTLQRRGELAPLDARDANLLLEDMKRSCKILRSMIDALQKEEFDKWQATMTKATENGTATPEGQSLHPLIKPSISKPSRSASRKTEPGTS
jgi:hypothetical protein